MGSQVTEPILSLLAVVLIPSLTGAAIYFAGRFIEKKAQLLVFTISVVSFATLSLITLAFVFLGVANPLSPLVFLLCICLGSVIHKKSNGASPDLFQAFLFMFLMSELNCFFAMWIPGDAIEKYYLVKMGIVPTWLSSVFLFFSVIAPTIAASYLLIFQNSKLRPGVDKHFDE